MKKIINLLLILFITIFITSCGVKKSDNESSDSMFISENSLVLYFSATGNTKNVAEKISEVTKSDIIEIIPKNKYTSDDLNYNNISSRANLEQNEINARPEIENNIDISKYDTIYLGYPIWWGTNPKIILSLLDNIDFRSKNVILFATSGSSGIEKSFSDLKEYKSDVNFISAKRLSNNVSEKEIIEWLSSINKSKNVIYVKVKDKVLPIDLIDNSSSKALIEKLNVNDIRVSVHDYGNFEKVGSLGFTLPTNDENIKTLPGDVILYLGSEICFYYNTNTWNFTKLGHINKSEDEIKEIFSGDILEVTLTLNNN